LSSLGIRRPLTFHILIFSFETTWPNEPKQTKIHPDPLTNMTSIANSFSGWVNFEKIFSSEIAWPNYPTW
jgi:hypothetical protein